jgi:hypothetical protein
MIYIYIYISIYHYSGLALTIASMHLYTTVYLGLNLSALGISSTNLFVSCKPNGLHW